MKTCSKQCQEFDEETWIFENIDTAPDLIEDAEKHPNQSGPWL